MPAPWLTASALAENLSISVPTVHRWAKKGAIPPGRRIAGGVRLWQWSEVERMLGSQKPVRDWERIIDEAKIESRKRNAGKGH